MNLSDAIEQQGIGEHDRDAVDKAVASIEAHLRGRGDLLASRPALTRKALRRERRALRRKAMEDQEVPVVIRILMVIIPKLLPPPWNVIVSAIFFVVDKAIAFYSDNLEQLTALCEEGQ